LYAARIPAAFPVPPVDRDEARFARATKQMIETGDYIDIKFRTGLAEPVGHLWLQAGVFVRRGTGVPGSPAHLALPFPR
jgi:4-amino-4-deoxy-L-arabinose transferase-like glycosyltransferase